MRNNRFYNTKDKQTRLENKIKIYKEAFQDKNIRDSIDKLPKTEETLQIIESELQHVVAGMKGSEAEKWAMMLKGLKFLTGRGETW